MIPQSDLAAMVRRAEADGEYPTDAQALAVLREQIQHRAMCRPMHAAASGSDCCDAKSVTTWAETCAADRKALAAALSEAMAALKHGTHLPPGARCPDCTAARALLAAFYGEGK